MIRMCRLEKIHNALPRTWPEASLQESASRFLMSPPITTGAPSRWLLGDAERAVAADIRGRRANTGPKSNRQRPSPSSWRAQERSRGRSVASASQLLLVAGPVDARRGPVDSAAPVENVDTREGESQTVAPSGGSAAHVPHRGLENSRASFPHCPQDRRRRRFLGFSSRIRTA